MGEINIFSYLYYLSSEIWDLGGEFPVWELSYTLTRRRENNDPEDYRPWGKKLQIVERTVELC